jgi:hypothetical protein
MNDLLILSAISVFAIFYIIPMLMCIIIFSDSEIDEPLLNFITCSPIFNLLFVLYYSIMYIKSYIGEYFTSLKVSYRNLGKKK